MPKRDSPGFIAQWSVASSSERVKPSDVAEILETFVSLGRAHRTGHQFTR